MKNKKVLISGAGVAGLTLAYWLKQYGFIPTLIEKHPELRTGGYKIDVRGAALEVLKRMGNTYQSVLESKTDMQGANIISGESITTMDADLCGTRVKQDIEIMRGTLCTILYHQIGEVECLFGDRITKISQAEDGVMVEFEKNQSRHFDLVIGADGLHSNVRNLVFGEESQFLKELGMYISIYSIPNYLNLDRWELEYYEPQKFVNIYSTRGDQVAKAGFAFASKNPLKFDLQNNEFQKQFLADSFSKVGWEVPHLLKLMWDSPDFYFDCTGQIHLPHWSKGRVALVGDAGYASSPFSGQGISVAIVGAYVLAGELASAHGDFNRAYPAYEQCLRRFVKKNQDLVKMTLSIMTDNSWRTWLHTRLMKILPSKWSHFLKEIGTKRVQKAANDLKLKTYN